MPFSRSPFRTPARDRTGGAVFAVGRRVCIGGGSDRSARVTLTDGAEKPLATLRAGAEVTIVAWLPGSSGSTRYCVRVTDSGLEGWLLASQLKAPIPPPVATPPPPAARPAAVRAAEARKAPRRVGQRLS